MSFFGINLSEFFILVLVVIIGVTALHKNMFKSHRKHKRYGTAVRKVSSSSSSSGSFLSKVFSKVSSLIGSMDWEVLGYIVLSIIGLVVSAIVYMNYGPVGFAVFAVLSLAFCIAFVSGIRSGDKGTKYFRFVVFGFILIATAMFLTVGFENTLRFKGFLESSFAETLNEWSNPRTSSHHVSRAVPTAQAVHTESVRTQQAHEVELSTDECFVKAITPGKTLEFWPNDPTIIKVSKRQFRTQEFVPAEEFAAPWASEMCFMAVMPGVTLGFQEV